MVTRVSPVAQGWGGALAVISKGGNEALPITSEGNVTVPVGTREKRWYEYEMLQNDHRRGPPGPQQHWSRKVTPEQGWLGTISWCVRKLETN